MKQLLEMKFCVMINLNQNVLLFRFEYEKKVMVTQGILKIGPEGGSTGN